MQKKMRVAILLNLLGTDGLKVYNTQKIPEVTIFEILKALEAYCIPRKNEVMENIIHFLPANKVTMNVLKMFTLIYVNW